MTETFVNHCIKMYQALNDRATDKELESGGTARIFVGSYFECWRSTKIAQTYYTPVRKSLERHNAIDILQKGGRSADTVIHLKGLPEAWDVDGWNDAVGLTKQRQYATLASDVKEIKESLGGINIVNALQEFERRLVALETNLTSQSPEKPKSTKQRSK